MVVCNNPLLEGNLYIWLQASPGNTVPTAVTGTPAYRIYGLDGTTIMTSGSGSFSSTIDSQTGLFNATHAIASANGYAAGQTYHVRVTWIISAVTYSGLTSFTVM